MKKLFLYAVVASVVFSLGGVGASLYADDAANPSPLTLRLRKQTEVSPGAGQWHTVTQPEAWDMRHTAVIVCDMWDKHWCAGATKRVGEMAPRMNEVLNKARSLGALVIHCPSDTMDYYKDTPARKLAQEAPEVKLERPLQRWIRLQAEIEGQLPIDDRDGGCDCQPMCKNYKAWTRQIAALEIKSGDSVTDSAEAFYLMHSRGVKNVIVLGVHTNMCVLGRPFSIRQMVHQGQRVALVRDLTDTMYNPRSAPFVAHATGTDLVVSHIERHWCPTITSVDFLGGQEFRFAEDRRPTVAILSAEDEYETAKTLPQFALKHLGRDFRVRYIFADAKRPNHLPGLDALNDADVLLLSARRRPLPKAELDQIRAFVAAGKPVVGIRTASHAFALRADSPAPKDEALEQWPELDRDVLGGNYAGHHPEVNENSGVKTVASVLPEAYEHPIVLGFPKGEQKVLSTLYKVSPLSSKATPLVMGRVSNVDKTEPVAWTHASPGGGKVFYTSLGHKHDFDQSWFNVMLRNGVYWAVGRDVPPVGEK